MRPRKSRAALQQQAVPYTQSAHMQTRHTFSHARTKDELLELTIIDPGKAKRILANRESAHRSRQRKRLEQERLEMDLQERGGECESLRHQIHILQALEGKLFNEGCCQQDLRGTSPAELLAVRAMAHLAACRVGKGLM